ncbi:ATP-dependent RNA helicase DDX10-like protein [Sarcoptes scabiei]|uniref:ATP-dependent RNA helicase n=1 Tax=Sarcoptes scabiei TaxID=52283 RepID=A0A132A9Z2_SARSC|nr:ATP-dependent RNA helicase DDX10-like protein [Sarcoptes scabiei]
MKAKLQKKFSTNKNFSANNEALQLQVNEFEWSKFHRFDEIPITDQTKNGLRKNNYIEPTEIQRQSIGFALKGNDILGAAKTGSGKTLAFLVPVLECLYKNHWTCYDGVGALIISPTRELSYQIYEVLNKIGAEHEFSCGLIIGGKDLKFETKRLDRCNIIVCTPGRLLQHMDENPRFNCDNLKILVLDEADRILDLGFSQTMNAIIENLPKDRQTLLFSATQTKSIKDLAKLSLRNPIYVSSHELAKHVTPNNLIQSYIVCQIENKINLLWSFIKQHINQKIIVFMSTCKQVKFIHDLFCHLRPGSSLFALYGNLHQLKRMNIYDQFCRTTKAVLIATDIAARGLDFPSIDWVIQLDCPEDTNTYIHRVGRTARFQKNGHSLLMLLPTEEESMINQLKARKVPIEKIKINPKKHFSILRKIEANLAKHPSLKESAQRAFKSYLKSVCLMNDKTVFKYECIDLDAFAKSFGLLTTPRVRFIEKKLRNLVKVKSKFDFSLDEDEKCKIKTRITEEEVNSDSEEWFQLKQYQFDAKKLLFSDPVKQTEILKVSQKTPSRTSMARKLLKKNIRLNKKIIFDDDFDADQYHNEVIAQQSEKFTIEKAKEHMKKEDIIDKQLYKNVLREKRLLKKMKAEASKRKEFEADHMLYDDDEQHEALSDAINHNYIDELPDPDQVFLNADSQNDFCENESPESNDHRNEQSNLEISSKSKKRKYPEEHTQSDDDQGRQKDKNSPDKDLKYYEKMAQKLLKF